MTGTATITPLHIERGRQMRAVVRHDVVNRSLTFEQSVASLAEFLGTSRETVMLGIAIANESDGDDLEGLLDD